MTSLRRPSAKPTSRFSALPDDDVISLRFASVLMGLFPSRDTIAGFRSAHPRACSSFGANAEGESLGARRDGTQLLPTTPSAPLDHRQSNTFAFLFLVTRACFALRPALSEAADQCCLLLEFWRVSTSNCSSVPYPRTRRFWDPAAQPGRERNLDSTIRPICRLSPRRGYSFWTSSPTVAQVLHSRADLVVVELNDCSHAPSLLLCSVGGDGKFWRLAAICRGRQASSILFGTALLRRLDTSSMQLLLAADARDTQLKWRFVNVEAQEIVDDLCSTQPIFLAAELCMPSSLRTSAYTSYCHTCTPDAAFFANSFRARDRILLFPRQIAVLDYSPSKQLPLITYIGVLPICVLELRIRSPRLLMSTPSEKYSQLEATQPSERLARASLTTIGA
ncbi:hypothetical protein C8R45DRAFT_937016 [Mycena sanguinolenta]|nr:hypothetical protein C8R45DRAFT_937016 [Mycena sanguinolenta]